MHALKIGYFEISKTCPLVPITYDFGEDGVSVAPDERYWGIATT
jgi:hypothetical protein